MTHSAVDSITKNSSEWVGTWDGATTGQWLDYALLLVCFIMK